MPVVDGHAVAQVTRERSPHACLVVITARADEKAEELSAAGACIVVNKPLDFDEVTKIVADCRARGGPGARGHCHRRSQGDRPPIKLHRR